MTRSNRSETRWESVLGIHTAGDDESRSDKHHSPYQPTPYCVLERIADSGLIRRGDLLIDFGSGKGRVSVFMSHVTGCGSIGIEYDPRLCDRARENIGRHTSVSFECIPAEQYDIPENANRFYFFNPFSTALVRRVVRHIADSYARTPRDILILFYFPVDDLSFMYEEGFLLSQEIDCNDLFGTRDPREKLCVYLLSSD